MSTSSFSTRLDALANVLTIGTCLIVCALVISKVYRQATAAVPDVFPRDTVLGSTDDVRFDAAPLTILVGLQTDCRYCADSMPGFREIESYVTSRKDGLVSIVAVGAESRDKLAQYLQTNRLTVYRPVSITRGSVLAPVAMRTPALVLVNRLGAVLASWPGVLTPERTADVIAHIESALPGRPSRTVPDSGGGR